MLLCQSAFSSKPQERSWQCPWGYQKQSAVCLSEWMWLWKPAERPGNSHSWYHWISYFFLITGSAIKKKKPDRLHKAVWEAAACTLGPICGVGPRYTNQLYVMSLPACLLFIQSLHQHVENYWDQEQSLWTLPNTLVHWWGVTDEHSTRFWFSSLIQIYLTDMPSRPFANQTMGRNIKVNVSAFLSLHPSPFSSPSFHSPNSFLICQQKDNCVGRKNSRDIKFFHLYYLFF